MQIRASALPAVANGGALSASTSPIPESPTGLKWLLLPFDAERRARRPLRVAGLDAVEWQRIVPFLAMHAACLLIPWVGWSPIAVATAVLLYGLRMFAITAFYHRAFSHRAFAAPRWVWWIGAIIGTASAQRGPLWWAAHHRRHHRVADTGEDRHAPQHGFWWSHMGWFLTRRNLTTDLAAVPDLAACRVLRWLDRYDMFVPFALLLLLGAFGAVLAWGWPASGTGPVQMMVWGFCLSTVVLFHATAAINSCAHRFGRRVWPTRDDSRNSTLLALLTFGEGWHNNHHWCPGAVRQGFRWWQFDLTWYLLVVMAWLRLVRPLRPLPARARLAARSSLA
ncbi:MAG: acyl-CoA desaturase [Planctomycetes bacterium]|nr:acyl-CoA desaturase [Planctomycetota bacterium]